MYKKYETYTVNKPTSAADIMRAIALDEPTLAVERNPYSAFCVTNTKTHTAAINPSIKNVIFNPPATIVFRNDGTKTVVKCQNDEAFDPEKGLTMAISKKYFGNKGSYCNQIKKWTEKYEEQLLDNGRLFAYMSARVTKIANRLHLIKNVHRIQTAYTTLTDVLNKKRPRKDDLAAAMEEAIGYLGEVLDD